MKKVNTCTVWATVLFVLFAVSCSNKKKESAEDIGKSKAPAETVQEKNKKTALASINAFVAGDINGTLKYLAPDAIDYGDGSGAPIKGIDSIKAALQTWRSALSVYKGNDVWAIADGDNVAVVGEWSGTFKTDVMGIKTTGKSFTIKDVDLFKFNDQGKIISHRDIQSRSTIISKLGVEAGGQ